MTQLVLVLACLWAQGAAQDSRTFVGTWTGRMDAQPPLRLVLRITSGDGGLDATVDSPDQGAAGIAFAVRIDGDRLVLTHAAAGLVIEGRAIDNGRALEMTFKQGAVSVPLLLKKEGVPPAVAAPAAARFRAHEVHVRNVSAGISLAGTLTLPDDIARAPVFLLWAGSGPQDRDGTVFGHKPWLALASWLAERGFASLRLDDRGSGESEGRFDLATTRDFVADAAAAVTFLRGRNEIDAARIGVIGHSEGALVAASLGASDPSLAGLVLLAPPVMSGEELMVARSRALLTAANVPARLRITDGLVRRAMFAALRGSPDAAGAVVSMRAAAEDVLATLSSEDRATLGWTREALESAVTLFAAQLEWFRFWLSFDPAATYRSLRVPVLAVFGALDQQVPPSQHRPLLERALASHRASRIAILPSANHLMQRASTGAPSEYASIREPFSPDLLVLLEAWLATVVAPVRF